MVSTTAAVGTLYRLAVESLPSPSDGDGDGVTPEERRIVEIRGDQTLRDLHGIILTAFGRWQYYLTEFLFDDGPLDCGGIRYGPGSPSGTLDPFELDRPVFDAATTRIDELDLTVNLTFSYWFNLWDDWYHQITVLAIGEAEPT